MSRKTFKADIYVMPKAPSGYSFEPLADEVNRGKKYGKNLLRINVVVAVVAIP